MRVTEYDLWVDFNDLSRDEVTDGKRVGVVCNLDTFRGSTA